MEFMTWKNDYSVNVSEFDNQHKRILEMINQLYSSMKEGKSKNMLDDLLLELSKYSQSHFMTEEEYFNKLKYPGLAEQMQEHQFFISKVTQIKKDLESGKIGMSLELMSFLKDWWNTHINKVDKKYTTFMNQNGIK